MNKLLKSVMLCGVFAAAALLTGCSATTTLADGAGMYASETGRIAIGKVSVQSIPTGIEAAIFKYSEDNAWLAPSMKLHEIYITLTGTNAVTSAQAITKSVCQAFIAAAAVTNAPPATTLYEQQTKRAELKEAAKALKSATSTQPEGAATTAATAAASAACTDCTDGSCADCTDGTTPSSVE